MKNEFKTQQAYQCAFGSFANALRYLGNHVNEYDVFHISEAVRMVYALSLQPFNQSLAVQDEDIREIVRHNNIYIGMRLNEVFLKLEQEMCVDFHLNTPVHFDLSQIKEIIRSGFPIVCAVSSHLLKYHSVYQGLNTFRHFITVFDLNEQHAFISDCYIPSYPVSIFQGTIDLKEFIDILEDEKTTIYVFDKKKIIELMKIDNLKRLVNSLEMYTGESVNKNIGSSGMDIAFLLAEDLKKMARNSVSVEPNFFTNLKFQLDHMGVISGKKILLSNLLDIAPIFESNNSEYRIRLSEFEKIIKVWNSISLQLTKLSLKYEHYRLENIAKLIENISIQEKNYMQWNLELLARADGKVR